MLELKNIVKKYGNNVILDDISLQIKKGEINDTNFRYYY